MTNCQIAVSVHAIIDACSAVLNWRLFPPQRWDDALAEDRTEAVAIAERQRRCHIPDDQRHHPKWRQVLEMLDELAAWGLVRLAKIRWRIEHDYCELKTGLGLTHFEGRSWNGWHRHVTLVSAAHLFLTELRLTSPKAARVS